MSWKMGFEASVGLSFPYLSFSDYYVSLLNYSVDNDFRLGSSRACKYEIRCCK